MAEYVEVNQLLSDMGEDDPKDIALYIAEYQKADVVKRSEYEKLKQKNIELEIEYDNVMKMNFLRVTEYKQLRSRIDKAIKEMRCYLKTIPGNEEFINGIEHSIKILKRNLEDIDF